MQTGHDLARNRSGYWEIRYSEKQEDGKYRSRSVSTGTKDRGEAERFKEDFLNHEARLASVGHKPTVAEIIDAYVIEKPVQDFVLRAVKRELGHYAYDLLTPQIAKKYKEARFADGIATGTVQRELSALTTALNWAALNRMNGGAVKAVDIPHIPKPPPSTPRTAWLNEEQEPVFHALAMGLSMDRKGKRGHKFARLTLFVGIGLDTAARKEAILDLTWDRVDFAMNKIDFRVPGKRTGNKRRTVVAISKRLRPLLEAAHDNWVRRGSPPEPVVGAGEIRMAWDRWVGGAGFPFPWMTPHLMRHSWAKLNARAGVPLFDVAAVLGDRMETVSRNYLHDCPGNSSVVDHRF